MNAANPVARDHEGDLQGLRDLLIAKHEHVVGAVMKKLAKYIRPDAREDARAAGNLGLGKAADSYDPTRRACFVTFAWHCISNEMRGDRAVSEWLERRVYEDLCRVRAVHDKLAFEESGGPHHREPLEQRIAEALNAQGSQPRRRRATRWTPAIVKELLLAGAVLSPGSLDQSQPDSSGEGGAEPLSATIPDPSQAVDEQVELREAVREALARLPERQADAARLRYIEQMGRAGIAAHLRVSRATVDRLLSDADAGLRQSLADFLE